MARKRKARTKTPLPDADDVLAGRADAGLEQLFELIHQVNPTSRRLPEKEQARRYAQKSRLQSLLIRRFGDEHLAVEATGHENLIVLNHRSGARHACHSVISELDDDARAWVRLQLDLAAVPVAGEPEPWIDRIRAQGEEPDDEAAALLRRGRQAIQDYDYEAAERLLARALKASRGTPADGAALHLEAALALLELEVDLLGIDQRALELEPLLAVEVRDQPRVRELLALAAARLGDEEQALALLRGTSPGAGMSQPRTAEVYATLAAGSLRRRDRRAGERYLRLVTEHDPTHPEIPRLGEEIAALDAEEQRRAEDELERRWRADGAAAVEEAARELADRWPASEPARRILRQLARARRDAEIAAHLEAAERALAEERFEDAGRRYRAAREAGCERPDLPALIEDAEARAARRRDRQVLEAALRRFERAEGPRAGDPEARAALSAYLGLPERLRAPLRQRQERPALAWLDALGAPASGAQAREAVDAVLALERAEAKLDAGDAAGALGALKPHRELLQALDDARRIAEEAQARLDAERRERTREVLDAALDAFGSARLARARRLLARIHADSLDGAGRARVRRLERDLERAETLRHLEQEAERHLAAGDPLGALERVRRLAELDAEGEAATGGRWQRQAEELEARLADAWRAEVADEPVPLSAPQGVFPSPVVQPPLAVLDDDGRWLVLANVWHEWLFLRVVDVARGEVVTRFSLRPPEPLEAPATACWDGDRVTVTGAGGGHLELRPRTGEILAWRPVRDLVPGDGEVWDVLALPGSAYLWLVVRGPSPAAGEEGDWQMHTVDLASGRLARKLPAGRSWGIPIFGPGEPRVVFSGEALPARLYSAHGAPSPRPLLSHGVLFGAPSPDGEGLVLMASSADPAVRRLLGQGEHEDDEDDDDDEPGVVLVRAETAAGGGEARLTSGLELRNALAGGANLVASSLEQGLGFALPHYDDFERDLLAFEVADGELKEIYLTPVPYHTMLVTDRRARRVFALVSGETGLSVHPLGRGQPDIPLPDVPDPDAWEFPDLEPPFECWRLQEIHPTHLEFAELLTDVGAADRDKARATLDAQVARAENLDAAVYLCRVLRQLSVLPELREQAIRRLADAHPDHAGVALLKAAPDAEAGRWRRVLEILRPIEPEPDDTRQGYAAHFHHLLGLAWLHAGDVEEARRAFEAGLEAQEYGLCNLNPLIDLTRPMADPAAEQGTDQPVIRQLLSAIRLADSALAAGEAEAAAAALERPVVWREVEVQSAARLAAAWLEILTPAPGDRFRKRVALAFFRHALAQEGADRHEILLPGLAWSQDRLTELDDAARRWLEGEHEG